MYINSNEILAKVFSLICGHNVNIYILKRHVQNPLTPIHKFIYYFKLIVQYKKITYCLNYTNCIITLNNYYSPPINLN